jgi:adenylate kinase
MGLRLVILGAAGSGRGTQAMKLSQQFTIPHISTGEMLRRAIATQNKLGKEVQSYVEQGEFVPDKIMIELMRQRLQEPDAAGGWVLDGYPLTAFQAEELDFLLDDLAQQLDWAIWLEVPIPVLVERSRQRSRSDDEPDTLQRRIELVYQRTVPILDYYGYRKRLLNIDGHQDPDAVYRSLQAALGIH